MKDNMHILGLILIGLLAFIAIVGGFIFAELDPTLSFYPAPVELPADTDEYMYTRRGMEYYCATEGTHNPYRRAVTFTCVPQMTATPKQDWRHE